MTNYVVVALLSYFIGSISFSVIFSRKFAGLYNNLGYDCVVDMQNLTTEQAFEQTMEYVESYKKLIEKRNISIGEINSKSERTIEIFEEILRGVR